MKSDCCGAPIQDITTEMKKDGREFTNFYTGFICLECNEFCKPVRKPCKLRKEGKE